MKLSKVELHEGGKEDKREFSRFKTMTDSLKRGAVAAALLFSATFAVNCGPSPDPQPDGSGGDGGAVVDGGHDSGDGGSDGGAGGLCAMYPHGSANRAEMMGGAIVKPGNNTEGWLMFFKSTDGTAASIGIYPDTLSSPPVYYAFTGAGQTRTIPVPGSTGNVNMQMCSVTSQPCSVGQPQGTITGDQNCVLVIAADKPFGLP